MSDSLPAVVHTDGSVRKYDEKKLVESLRRRRIAAADRKSIVLRVRAELRSLGVKRITIAELKVLIRASVDEVTGGPVDSAAPAAPTEDAGEPGPEPPTVEEPAPEPEQPTRPSPGDPPGRFFTWDEFQASSKASELGLDNRIPDEVRPEIRALCREVLDGLRMAVGESVMIRSGYRCKALNVAIKGAPTSQHMAGEAADIKTSSILDGRRQAEWLAAVIVESGFTFDQVVWYHPSQGGHVHVSYNRSAANRRETLYRDGSGYHHRTPRR